MKTFVVLAVLGFAVGTFGYGTEHDDVDVGAIISDKEKLQSLLGCFAGKTPCNKLGQALKDNLPDALREACTSCNPVQKEKLKLLFEGLKEKFPAEYAEFKKQADPEGKYFDAFIVAVSKA